MIVRIILTIVGMSFLLALVCFVIGGLLHLITPTKGVGQKIFAFGIGCIIGFIIFSAAFVTFCLLTGIWIL